VITPAARGVWLPGMTEATTPTADVDRLLTRLTRFSLRHSAEGAFELRDMVRQTAAAFGSRADVLALAEGAVLEVNHPDGSQTVSTLRVMPELTRLDLVADAKFLQREIVAGQVSAAAAHERLGELERSPNPYPAWLRVVGVVLFAAGFAPRVQATWREVWSSLLLGAVMGLLFVLADRVGPLRTLLPIAGPIVVGVVAFAGLHAHRAPGGPMAIMIPALFVLIPGDFLCAATAEIAVGQLTPGAVRLAQAVFVLVELTAGVVVAAEISRVGTSSLFERHVATALPGWLLALAWIPFSIGLALTFSARLRDVPWIGLLVYLAWGVQLAATKIVGPTAGTFIAAVALALAAGLLERSDHLPPRIVLILGGFFALTVGAVALRGLTTLDGGYTIQGFYDLRDAILQTAALTLGLVVGAVVVLRLRAGGRPAADRHRVHELVAVLPQPAPDPDQVGDHGPGQRGDDVARIDQGQRRAVLEQGVPDDPAAEPANQG
jgi:uncharacterized membrane protein YjjP (DUF1212 family)